MSSAGDGTRGDSRRKDGTQGDGTQGIGRLADLLAQAGDGEPPTSVELAELLWLAGHMAGPEAPGDSAAGHPPEHEVTESRTPTVPPSAPSPRPE
ncbi:hypothetical protein, partial [Streptomyces spongiae]